MAWHGSECRQDKNDHRDRIMITSLDDCITVVDSSALIFHGTTKGLKGSTVGKSVLHVVSSRMGEEDVR